MNPIRVLIVDDSSVFRLMLKAMLQHEPDIEVIGEATNGIEAIEMTQALKPDLITMDILMPYIDGIEATRRIMNEWPTPIIVITSSTQLIEPATSFEAIEQGALMVMGKPEGYAHPDFDKTHRKLLETVRIMAEVPVVKRPSSAADESHSEIAAIPSAEYRLGSQIGLIAIGSSTGGPAALQTILSRLPSNLSVPVVIVQHISDGFIDGFAKWLQVHSKLPIHVAYDGQMLRSGNVYLAPQDNHFLINRHSSRLYAHLSQSPEVNHTRPSVDVLFQSIAQLTDLNSVALLLSGMGKDGVEGMAALKKAKAKHHNIVQDKKSAVIWGMPGSAVAQEVVDTIVPLNNLAQYLTNLLE